MLRSLKKYNAAAIIAGFFIAHSGSAFLESVIHNLLMPLFNPFISADNWTQDEFTVGQFVLKWGEPVASALHMVLVLGVVLSIIRFLEPEEEAK